MNRSKRNASPPEYSAILHWLGRLVMSVFGWKVKGHRPDAKKYIIVAAPHTSNWDLIFFLGAAFTLRIKVSWLGKKNIFVPVFSSLFRSLGGIPVDRSQTSNRVKNLAREIDKMDRIALGIAPAGTRSRTEYWKSGFYWVALECDIPIVCGYLDYSKKEAGLGLSIFPCGDLQSDMEKLRNFYGDIAAKFPEKKSLIRAKDEK